MRSNRSSLPNWLSVLLSVAFVGSTMAVLVFAFLTAQVIWNRPLNPLEVAAAQAAGVDLSMEQEGPAPAPTLLAGQPTPTLIPTNEFALDAERVNILLMGIDRRPGEPFISRTDSIMIMSLDVEDETVSILSVPRDLYVVIPGRGRDRINTAFVYGATGDNPAGGAALSMQTIEYNLGIHLDHYVLVDFSAVINGVDALGGIDVTTPKTINDPTYPDMNYGYDPLYIPAGEHHFNGELALKYARTRHQDSDFGRAARQQQVVLAVRRKALSLGVTEMVRRAPALYGQLQRGVRTDLSLDQLVQLARVAAEVPTEQIRNEVLDQNYVSSYRTPGGASVLVLDNEKAADLIQRLFYD